MKVLKSLSLYTFIGFLGAGINFFIMPVLSHHLTPDEYGILSLINSYVTILIPLVGLVASGLINIEYYKIKDKAEFASLVSSVQLIPIIPFLFFLLSCSVLYKPIVQLSELTGVSRGWVLSIPVLAFLMIYTETFSNYLIVRNKPTTYTYNGLVKILGEVSLTLLFVVGLKMGWKGRILSWMIIQIIFFVYSLIYFYKQGLLTINVKKSYILQGVAFGAPLILHTIGKFVVNQSDRIFIAKYISLEETGIYNIGYQVGMILMIIINAFSNFFTPYLYERLHDMNEQKKIEVMRMGYIGFFTMVVALIGITVATPFFFAYFVDKRYAEGTIYVFWTGLSYLFWGVYLIFSGFIYYAKKTRILAWLSLINVALNIALNFALITRFGALGASYATCISFLVTALWIVYFANKYYPLPWLDVKRIFARSR